MDCRPLAAAAAACAGRHVLVLERDLMRDAALTSGIFAGAKSVTVLDHIATPSTESADIAIAVASFAESDGVFVNLEGRAQAFFKAVFTESDPPPSWHVLRHAAIIAGRIAPDRWQNHAALLADLAEAIPRLAGCGRAWPSVGGARLATLPYRSSGRTAATANLDVREPLPFQHEDSPFSTTMEGSSTWSPGWNSVQAVQRFPAAEADTAEVFLFSDSPGEDFEVPAGRGVDLRTLGREEMSDLSPAIIARREAS
jgi:NADH-quinone oxidoreductase subunit G